MILRGLMDSLTVSWQRFKALEGFQLEVTMRDLVDQGNNHRFSMVTGSG